jgi:hypothetical protein
MRGALSFGPIILASTLNLFATEPQSTSESAYPISEKTRSVLLSMAASRGFTNVVELKSFSGYSFILSAATNRSDDISTYRVLSIVRNYSGSNGTNTFRLESDEVQTNFMIQIGDKERWFALGPATPLDFAQNAVKIWLKHGFGTDERNFVICERPTNATDVVKFSFGDPESQIPTAKAFYFRVRDDRLSLLLCETTGPDWVTRIGSSTAEPYFPPGSEETEKRYQQRKAKEQNPLPLPAQIE